MLGFGSAFDVEVLQLSLSDSFRMIGVSRVLIRERGTGLTREALAEDALKRARTVATDRCDIRLAKDHDGRER